LLFRAGLNRCLPPSSSPAQKEAFSELRQGLGSAQLSQSKQRHIKQLCAVRRKEGAASPRLSCGTDKVRSASGSKQRRRGGAGAFPAGGRTRAALEPAPWHTAWGLEAAVGLVLVWRWEGTGQCWGELDVLLDGFFLTECKPAACSPRRCPPSGAVHSPLPDVARRGAP